MAAGDAYGDEVAEVASVALSEEVLANSGPSIFGTCTFNYVMR